MPPLIILHVYLPYLQYYKYTGFSDLSSYMTSWAGYGPVIISDILNVPIVKILSIVHAHGGSLIQMVDETLMVAWYAFELVILWVLFLNPQN
jgi:hypothetical protein